MRLIGTLQDGEKALVFSAFLQSQGIENQIEIHREKDWGSDGYGTTTCNIWAVEEDRFDEALALAKEFLENPSNPKFSEGAGAGLRTLKDRLPKTDSQNKAIPPHPAYPAKEPLKPITRLLLILCTALFLLINITLPEVSIQKLPVNIPTTPLFTPPLYKALVYDYPKAYEIIDEIDRVYGPKSLESPQTLPKEGKLLLQKFYITPYWQGCYESVVAFFKGVQNKKAPMFEKIKEGQVWRFFTPAFLHAEIFHYLFNMIWLFILGKQLEKRLGAWRYLLFILIAAVFSNTAQYLMSGANFIGISGVLCAMIMFIWMRQKRAPWEGYQLDKATMGFISFFVLFMLFIQVAGFFLEIYTSNSFSAGIANTAHLSGALIGYLLARLKTFAAR